jgi:GrpB-like predicted nucleotidyltransferase (UPF0157 family)
LLEDNSMVVIVEPNNRWPFEFTLIEAELHEAISGDGRRIDHIGSTSVPDLPAKDVIDVQVTVADEPALERVPPLLVSRGWRLESDIVRDHHVPGLPADPSEWRKVLLREPDERRRINVHVRIDGRANQRYALLFRDYLREQHDAAAAYAEVKRGLAALAPDIDRYADAKDPACDLIYLAAEKWASERGWTT